MAKRKYDDSSITTLSGLEHVRFRAGMYGFGGFGKAGIFLMCKEILDNAFDELGVDQSVPQQIDVTFIKKRNTFQCIVQDTGRGVPLRKIKPIYTDANTSGKWAGAYGFSIGSNGIGAKGTVSLSTNFAAVSRRPEGMASITTRTTKIDSHTVIKTHGSSDSGTIVFFEPDYSVMKNAKTFFDKDGGYDDIIQLIEFASVNLPNTVINVHFGKAPIDTEKLHGISPDKLWDQLQPQGKIVYSPDKTLDYVSYMLGNKNYEPSILWDSGMLEAHELKVPVTVQTGTEHKKFAEMGYKVRFILTKDSHIVGRNQLLTSVNMVRMQSRTASQVIRLVEEIKRFLYPHVEEKYQEYFNTSYTLPFHLISLANWQHAVFINQDKSDFVDDDFASGFGEALGNAFLQIGEDRWVELATAIAEDIKLKWSRKHKRDLGISADSKNLAFSLHNPRCYYECKETGTGTELLICEGVSSGDYVKQLRDSKTQAVFELKGKILNAFKKGENDLDTLRKNHVISDLLQVLGTSPEDTELENLRFERIGILSDADPDGNHITTLVMSDLYHINPQLFEQKRVFVLNPPLYILNLKGNNNPMFIRDKAALMQFQADLYASEYDISMRVGKKVYPLKGKEYYSMCAVIKHLGDIIKDVGNKQHVDPAILEMLAYCLDDLRAQDATALTKKLKLDASRFDQATQTLYLETDGLETVVPMSGLVQELEQRLLPEIERFHLKDMELIVTSKHGGYYKNASLSIMLICNAFAQMDTLYRIRRMKGIGEMDKKHLVQTCLNPITRSCTAIKGIGDINRIAELMGNSSDARKVLVMNKVE